LRPIDDSTPPVAEATTLPVYRHVRYAAPPEHPIDPPTITLLKGRFATRLGVDGRRHDYDLMDADPVSSGPFFEQLYPYTNIYAGVRAEERDQIIPLARFDLPEANLRPAPKAGGYALAETIREASAEFERFHRILGAQIIQFAMEDFTNNHIRILAALTLMRSPPHGRTEIRRLSRDLNAATRGETDTAALIAEELQRPEVSPYAGFRLRYETLSEPMLNRWLHRLIAARAPEAGFYRRLNQAVEARLNDLIRRSASPIDALEDAALSNGCVKTERAAS